MKKPTESPLERALAQARSTLGNPSDVQRLRDKLGALPPNEAPAQAHAANDMSLGAKIAAGTAIGALLIAGAMLATREPSPAPSERSFAPPPRASTALEPAFVPAEPTELAPPSPAVQAAAPEPAPVRPIAAQRRKRAESSTPLIEAYASGPNELALLIRAQDAIETSPQRALGLLNEHAHSYPSGNFAQERESLAIDALRKLGRATEAQARARAFIARFPKASNVKHLTRWLDESSKADHNERVQPLPTP